MKRLGALFVAIGLVAIALVIRSQRHTHATQASSPYRLTCATEFADVCRPLATAKLSVTIEAAGVTADHLASLPAATDPGFDAWLAAGPWADIATATRASTGGAPVTAAPADVGHSRVAVAVWRDRGGILRTGCGGTLSWKCIGDAAGRDHWSSNGGDASWGDVKIALADPAIDSGGLLGLAAATAAYVGSTTFSPADLSQNDAYQKWLGGLAGAIPRPAPVIAAVLAQGPAAADLYVGLDATITPVVNTSARRADIEVVYLSPVFDVPALLAPSAMSSRAVPRGIADAVRKAGWAPATQPQAVPAPSAAILAGLRRMWQDTVR